MVAVIGVAALVVGLIVAFSGGSSTPTAKTAAPAHAGKKKPASIPAVEAGVLPWALDQPLSREVLFPGSGTSVIVAGGLDAAGGSLARVFSLDTTSGAISPLGSLASPVHDAAGVELAARRHGLRGWLPHHHAGRPELHPTSGHRGRRRYGQRPASGAALERLGRRDRRHRVRGRRLRRHQPRCRGARDEGRLALLDGGEPSGPGALRRGRRTSGDHLYLFGGEAVGGHDAGNAVDTIQMVDPAAKDRDGGRPSLGRDPAVQWPV